MVTLYVRVSAVSVRDNEVSRVPIQELSRRDVRPTHALAWTARLPAQYPRLALDKNTLQLHTSQCQTVGGACAASDI